MVNFDLVIIGGGVGGYVSAIRAGQLGLKTALVEKNNVLGGTCLNVGCIPSKALLESSWRFYEASKELEVHGVKTGKVSFDLGVMMRRKEAIVKELTGGVQLLMKKNKVTVYKGVAQFESAEKLVVKEGDKITELGAKHFILATGSAPVELPFLPFDGKVVIDSTAALSLESVPKTLAVIGGGAIGLELASVYSRLGAEVTVVEMLDMIAPFADKQLSKTLQRALKAQGIEFKLATSVEKADIKKTKATLHLKNKKGHEETVDVQKVLVAVGRKPVTDSLSLDKTAATTDERGFVEIDEHWRTKEANIYALGDVTGGLMLAHKAEEEAVACVEKIAGKAGHVNYAAIPSVVYTHPELAQVGLTEEQLKADKTAYKVGKYFYKANGRAKSMHATEGLVKVLADEKTDKLLGVHIVGANAGELIAEAVAMMEFSASAEDIGRMVHAHPTLSEMLKEAALAASSGEAIHG